MIEIQKLTLILLLIDWYMDIGMVIKTDIGLIFTLILVLTFDSEINVDTGSKIMNDLDIDIEDGESLMGMRMSM